MNYTGISAANKVYDGTTTASLSGTAAKLTAEAPGGSTSDGAPYTGDTVSFTTGTLTGTFASKDVANGIAVTVTGGVTLAAGGQSANYSVGSPSPALAANITQAGLTVAGIEASNKVYDGTTNATLIVSNATLVGVVSPDVVSLDTTNAVGAFADADVGTNKTVTVSGLVLLGASAGNYTLTQPTTNADITAKELTVTGITASDKTYDASTTATLDTSSAALVGNLDGTNVVLSTAGASGAFLPDESVGTGKTVQVSGLTVSGSASGNYTLTQPTTSASIMPAALTVTGITASNKTYDGSTTATLDTSSAALMGNLDGRNVVLGTGGASGAFTPNGNVGTGKTVQVSGLTISGSASGNYTLTQPTTSASITPATLTVTGITASDKVYDGTTSATLNTSGAALVGNLDGRNVVLGTGGASGAFTPNGNVGTGKPVQVSGLTISGSASGNYTLTQPTTSASITPATLTVTGITASDKVYDSTTTATLNTSGAALVGNLDGGNVVLGTAGASGAFTPNGNVGTGKTVQVSGLTISGSASGNYTLTQPTTTASITPKTLTVAGITAANKTYDASTTATLNTGSAALVGNLDGGNVLLGTGGASGAFIPDGSVGTGKTVQVSGVTISGSASGNYTLTQPTTSASITPATLTVTGITASDKVYDGTTGATLNTSGAALVGNLDGRNVVLGTGGASGAFIPDGSVGTGKTVQVSGLAISGSASGNYTLTQPTTTANITQAGLTVAGIEASNKVYDGTTNATLIVSNATLVGVVSPDVVSLDTTNAVGAFADADVGTNKTVTVSGLVLLGASAGNYTLTQPTTNADITAKELTVTGITASDKTYDASTTATLDTSSAALVGNLDGTNVVLSTAGASGAFIPDGSVGTGKTVQVSGLTVSGSASGNYTLTQPTTSASITPAALTVTGITASDKVYDGTTSATLNTSGAALVGNLDGRNVVLGTGGASGAFTPNGNVGTGKPVQVSGLTISGSASGNYTLTQPTTSASITPKTLTVAGITAANKTYDASTAATLNTGSAALVGNLDGGNVLLGTGGASGAFIPDGSVGTGKTVQVSGVTISGSASGNYTLTQPTTSASITPATLTVTGITASDKVYDGTTGATLNTSGAALVGNLDGRNVVLGTGGASGAFIPDGSVGTGKTVQVSGLAISGSASGNYTLTQPTTTANITQAGLTVAGIEASNKVYDGTTNATLIVSNATLVGVVSPDVVSLDTTNAVGAFADADVGTNKTVTVSGLVLLGASAGNYTLTQPTTNADITAKELTVTGITASDKTYDASTTATLDTSSAALVGNLDGTNVVLSTAGASGAFLPDESVGTGKTVQVSGLTVSGSASGNYTLTQPTTSASIMPAALTVTGITASNKTYDGSTTATLDTSSAALMGNLDGRNVVLGTGGASGAFTPNGNVGTGKTVQVSGLTISGSASGNYTLTQPTTSASITPATLTVTGITASDKVYDGTTSATLNTSGAALVGNLDGRNVVLGTGGASGAFTPNGNVGTGKPVQVSGLTISGSASGNYTLTQPTTSASITPKTLTVAGITAANKTYDASTTATLNTGSAALVGNLDGGNVLLGTGGASGAFIPDGSVGTGKTVQVSGVTISGSASGNYTLTQPTTTASITPAALTVTGITASDKVYDGTTSATLNTSGAALVGNLDGRNVVLSTAGASGAFLPDGSVGTGKTVQVSGVTISGSASGNYTLAQPTTSANITTLGITGSFTAQSKTYNGNNSATVQSRTLNGVLPGDVGKVSLTGGTATFSDANVANGKTVTLTGATLSGTAAGNYSLTSVGTTTANIRALGIGGSFTASDKVYDGNNSATVLTRTLNGVLAVDQGNVSLTGGTATFANAQAGNAKVVTLAGATLTGSAAGNYFLSSVGTATANITPLGITGSFTAQSKVYDGNNLAVVLARSLTGVLAGDVGNVSLTGGTATFADANVGTGKTVTLTGASLGGTAAGNYLLTSVATTTADITQAGSATALSSSANPSVLGSNVTFTATVTPVAPATVTPTGTVQFYTNGIACDGPRPLSGGAATITLATLPIGYTLVDATYLPDSNFLGSAANGLQQLVHATPGTPITTGITNNGDGTVTVSFSGTPYAEYVVQASVSLAPPVWVNLSTNMAGADGKWTIDDDAEAQIHRFYRSAKP